MKPRAVKSVPAPRAIKLRALRFEEIPEVLRLIRRAIESGCRGTYDAHQRNAVWTGYAQTLFAESVGPFETIVAEAEAEAEAGGSLVGVAQWDAADERLRALFVDGERQRSGVGRMLLAEVEGRARRRGCRRLRGAMSLNAVPFYESEGYRVYSPPAPLRTAGILVPIVRMEKALLLG
jgi:GNAT superfamily N-acetyltransferase